MNRDKIILNIELGDTSTAFDNLKVLFSNDQNAKNDVIMLKSKYMVNEKHYNLGLTDYDQYLSVISKIHHAILYYILPKYQNYDSETKIPFSIKTIQILTDALKYTRSQNLQFMTIHLLYQLFKEEYGLLKQTLNNIENDLGNSVYKNIAYFVENKQQKRNVNNEEVNWLEKDYIQYAIIHALKNNNSEVNEGDLIFGLLNSNESNTIKLLKQKYPSQINTLITRVAISKDNQTEISLEEL
jgi:hypothetical protein